MTTLLPTSAARRESDPVTPDSSSRGSLSFDDACAQVIAFLQETAPMALWSVTRMSDDRQIYLAVQDDAYGMVVGDSLAWSDSFCQHMIAGNAPQIASDAMAIPEYAATAAARALTVGSYVGAPIRDADGGLFGTICAIDPEKRSLDKLGLASGLSLLADLLGRVLEASSLHEQAERRTRQAQEAQAELARSEEKYRFLVAAGRDVISRHTASGTATFVSGGVEEIFGWAPGDLVGRDLSDMVHPDDVADLRTDVPGTRGGSGDWTFRLRHRDGHWVWVESTWTVLCDDAGRVNELLVSSRDITSRRAREAALQQDSKLESLGRLSAGLAHEINTPIQYVGDNARFLADAFADLMALVALYRGTLNNTAAVPWQERLPAMMRAEEEMEIGYLETEVPSAVEQTLAGIDRVATIVRAMKSFSHPGNHEHVPSNINEALAATVTVVRHQVTSVAELELELGELPPVRCNIADLNQVFLNLIINAADAVEETGRRGVIRVCTRVDGGDVLVSVSDTGAGIPESIQAKIFDPFFTTKEVGRGTGQGLPLVRSVVQEWHGGTLSVDTRPDVGTTMIVRLPVAGKQSMDAA